MYAQHQSISSRLIGRLRGSLCPAISVMTDGLLGTLQILLSVNDGVYQRLRVRFVPSCTVAGKKYELGFQDQPCVPPCSPCA